MVRAPASAIVLGLLLSGCNTSPPAKFYTLNTQTSQANAQWSSPLSIAVDRVWVPDIVDRSQLVLRIDDAQVKVDEFARWAEPLSEQIASVLAADLSRSFPAALVTTAPQWGENDKLYRVSVDVQSFESVAGRSATIAAVWTVRPPNEAEPISGRSYAQVPVSTSDYDALVNAHSRALSSISADIARAIQASLGRPAARVPPLPAKR